MYQITEHKRKLGNEVMVGTITLLYDRLTPMACKRSLADLQYENIDEVMSSLHVHLTDDQIMEVDAGAGPRRRRCRPSPMRLIAQRGVVTGRLQLLAAVIPPLHGDVATMNKKK
jgi:CopG family nickel-responsive transcriptional regulator